MAALHRQLADVVALRFGELRRRGDLDQFLVAALDRAVAFEQVDDIAEAVADHLYFDMLGIDHAFFDEYFRLAEGLAGFGNHPVVVLDQFRFAVAAPDAASAAAVGGFQHDRIADFGGQFTRFLDVFQIMFAARHHRNAGIDHGLARLDLVAHLVDDFGGGADEVDAALGADFRQHRIFREEAIAGMQCVATGGDRQIDDVVCVEIADNRVGADVVGFVGFFDVQRMAVGIGIDGHRLDAHFRAGAHDADGDFAAVGNKDFLDHVKTRYLNCFWR